MMNYDIIFQHAVATADLTSILRVLENDSKVDTRSESFKLVLELSIQNREEAVLARLLRYIPNLALRARSQTAEPSRECLIL